MIYLCISALFTIGPGGEGLVPSFLNHLLHHLQLTGVWRGSPLKTLRHNRDVSGALWSVHFFFLQTRNMTTAHSAFRCSLVILLLLSFGLLLELDDRHPVQVAVGPTVVYAVLKQIFFKREKKRSRLIFGQRIRWKLFSSHKRIKKIMKIIMYHTYNFFGNNNANLTWIEF